MDVVYQIKSGKEVAYAADVAACDGLCRIILANGGTFEVRRMKRNMVPMCDLELVNGL